MRNADLNTPAAKLHDGLKNLRAHWETARGSWNDAVAREFEENYLAVFEPEVLATLERMGQLSQLLGSVEQQCDH